MATLKAVGWDAKYPQMWTDPRGDQWVIDSSAGDTGLLDLITADASTLVWKEASLAWCGEGLEAGLDADLSFAYHRSLQRDHQPRDLGMLETFLCGGYWPMLRRHQCGLADSPTCKRCGLADDSAFHMLWGCGANVLVDHSDVTSTQGLCAMACAGAQSYPCLWLRGLVPKECVVAHTPLPEPEVNYVGQPPDHGAWPSGTYWTDGSGGRHSAFPSLRRCGLAVSVVQPRQGGWPEFCWGAYMCLPGAKQTVPRSELMACILVLQNVSSGPVMIATDSWITVLGFRRGPEGYQAHENADLWALFWVQVRRLGTCVDLRWVKAHATTLHLSQGRVSLLDLFGNACADTLADRAAKDAEVFPGDAARFAWYATFARRVQKRAVAILLRVADPSPGRRDRSKRRVPRLLTDAHALGSQHSLFPLDGQWFCSECLLGRHSSDPGLLAWFKTSCVPGEVFPHTGLVGQVIPCRVPAGAVVRAGRHVLHGSHKFVAYKGLVYCERCGYYATSVPQLLKLECLGFPKRSSIPVLWRLRRGMLPQGLPCWPNEARPVEGFIDL